MIVTIFVDRGVIVIARGNVRPTRCSLKICASKVLSPLPTRSCQPSSKVSAFTVSLGRCALCPLTLTEVRKADRIPKSINLQDIFQICSRLWPCLVCSVPFPTENSWTSKSIHKSFQKPWIKQYHVIILIAASTLVETSHSKCVIFHSSVWHMAPPGYVPVESQRKYRAVVICVKNLDGTD